MIRFESEGVRVSVPVVRALLAFASTDPERPGLCSVGIESGDLCATDGHTAIRFKGRAEGERPTTVERCWFPRDFVVESGMKAARAERSALVWLPWSGLAPEGRTYPPLSQVEPADTSGPGGGVMFDARYLARLEVVAKACQRERIPGIDKEPVPMPGALIASFSGEMDPARFVVGGDYDAHVAWVTIMPMRSLDSFRASKPPKPEPKPAAKPKRARKPKAPKPPERTADEILSERSGEPEDARTRGELARLSGPKLLEAWTARSAQRNILSNVLYGRNVTREQRSAIDESMRGRPLADLRYVVARVLGAQEAAA